VFWHRRVAWRRGEREPVVIPLDLPDGLAEGPVAHPHQEVNSAAGAALAVLAAAVRAPPAAGAFVCEPAVAVIATAAGTWLVGIGELVIAEAADRDEQMGPAAVGDIKQIAGSSAACRRRIAEVHRRSFTKKANMAAQNEMVSKIPAKPQAGPNLATTAPITTAPKQNRKNPPKVDAIAIAKSFAKRASFLRCGKSDFILFLGKFNNVACGTMDPLAIFLSFVIKNVKSDTVA
jgi:hypothetical protein